MTEAEILQAELRQHREHYRKNPDELRVDIKWRATQRRATAHTPFSPAMLSKPSQSRVGKFQGERFGRLVVVERLATTRPNRAALWRCRCDCGNERVLDTNRLRKPVRSSEHYCSMMCPLYAGAKQTRAQVHVGERFGRLTVMQRVERPRQDVAWWLCRCDCGNERVQYTYQLRHPMRVAQLFCGIACPLYDGPASSKRNLLTYVNPRTDMRDRRFGTLVVSTRAHTDPARRAQGSCPGGQWHVRCDCGKQTTRTGHRLRRHGQRQYCGRTCPLRTLIMRRSLPVPQVVLVRAVLAHARRHA